MKINANTYSKQLGLKALGQGSAVTPEQLALINGYALTELEANTVYVRKFLIAHNAIDRDRERFNESILEDFRQTLPGKGLLWGHQWGPPGKGLFFDAATEEITADQFMLLTGEEPALPDGITNMKVLWGWAYIMRIAENEGIIANIDGGVYRHCSIGFKAQNYQAVTDNSGNAIYYEYGSKGEALEASLVWLGAQPGATAQKALDIDADLDIDKTSQGGRNMEFLKKLAEKIGKEMTVDNAADVLAAELDAKDASIAELSPLAEDGRAYRKQLIDDAVKYARMLDECGNDEEAVSKKVKFLSSWPIDELKTHLDTLISRAHEKFPTEFTVQGKDESDRQTQDTTDYNTNNPLRPKEDK